MPEGNVDVIRRLYEAMNARDETVAAGIAHADVEWISDPRTGQGLVQGREAVVRFFFDMAEMFDELRVELERSFEVGDDQVLAFIRVAGSGRSSGAGVTIEIAHLWTLSDGVLVRGRGYGNRQEALEATGLS